MWIARNPDEEEKAAYSFFFQLGYQSTDESAEEEEVDIVDPGSDQETIAKTKRRKRAGAGDAAWKTRAPFYRSHDVSPSLRNFLP